MRRDFPTPASPTRNRRLPLPRVAASKASRSAATSTARPTTSDETALVDFVAVTARCATPALSSSP